MQVVLIIFAFFMLLSAVAVALIVGLRSRKSQKLAGGRYVDTPSAFKIIGLIFSGICFTGYTVFWLIRTGGIGVLYMTDAWLGTQMPIISAFILMALFFLLFHGKCSSILPAFVFALLCLPGLREILIVKTLREAQFRSFFCTIFSTSFLLVGCMTMFLSGSKRRSRIWLVIGLAFMILESIDYISLALKNLELIPSSKILQTPHGQNFVLAILQELSLISFCGMLIAYLFSKSKATSAATAQHVPVQQPVYQQPVQPVYQPVQQPVQPVYQQPVQQPVYQQPVQPQAPAFCPYCGAKRTAGHSFCGVCGQKYS